MLDIKDLAGRYGIAVSPGKSYAKATNLYQQTKTNKLILVFILAVGLIPIYFLRRRISVN